MNTEHREGTGGCGLKIVCVCVCHRCALVAPGREWLHYAFRTFVARRAEMDPHALPMALWAFAKLGYHRTYLGNNVSTV